MKKKWLLSLAVAGCIAAGSMTPLTVYADAQKVVTLGADLSPDQKAAILKYFGVQEQNVQTLYITNQDERNHLASYVPIEQIGTRTFSCALVSPTSSGGIRVKTANLNWVTSNMIASTLSTSGVVNCDVLAASPFEVSGTGALTGIIMAYEQASGQTLDATKKEIATQEMVVTGNIANEVGQQQATQIVNEIKIQVIQNEAEEYEVEQIVDNVIDDVLEEEDTVVYLSEEDRELLRNLAAQIANQKYDYEEVKDTLERVENNVSNNNEVNVNVVVNAADQVPTVTQDQQPVEPAQQPMTEAPLDQDSILTQTDESALQELAGGNVVFDATNQDALEQPAQEPEIPQVEAGFEITAGDEWNSDPGEVSAGGWSEGGESWDNTGDGWSEGGESWDNTGDGWSEGGENWDNTGDGWSEGGESWDNTGDGLNEGGEGSDDEPNESAVFTVDDVKMVPDTTNYETPNALGNSFLFVDIKGYTGLQLFSGEFTVYDDSMQVVDELDVEADSSKFRTVDLIDENTGSVCGTRIVINVAGDLVDAYTTYNASFSGKVLDPATSAVADIDVNAQLATDDFGAELYSWNMDDFRAGSSIDGAFLMGDGAYVQADIIDYDWNMVSFNAESFTADAPEFCMSLIGTGSSNVTVKFYDADWNEYIYTFTVAAF